MGMRNIVGPIPDPDELYGREELLDYLWRQMSGCNILLLAPRRFGKSGIMRHVLERPRDGYLPLDFELEDVTTPQEFIWRLTEKVLRQDVLRSTLHKARRLPGALAAWVKDTFDEIEFQGAKAKFKQDIQDDWRQTASRMIVEFEKADPTLIFILDEFPAMIENIVAHSGEAVAEEFLAWFRTIRLHQKDRLRRHRFIVAGSIGIDTVIRRLNIADPLLDFQRIYVEPIPTPDAQQLAKDLAGTLEISWTDSLETEFLQLLGANVPYFIHMFFSQLGQLPIRNRKNLSVEDLHRTYQDQLLGSFCKHYFQHYSSRLHRLGKSGEKAAMAILRTVAGSLNGRVSRSALFDVYRKARGRKATDLEFDELLGDLEHDWYLGLDPNTNEYHFKLKIIQDWWHRWYPTPASRRPLKGRKTS